MSWCDGVRVLECLCVVGPVLPRWHEPRREEGQHTEKTETEKETDDDTEQENKKVQVLFVLACFGCMTFLLLTHCCFVPPCSVEPFFFDVLVCVCGQG